MNFHISNPKSLEEKLTQFTPENLRIVTDFDSTITADNGKTSWSLFANSGLMPEEYVCERARLKEHYYPFEISTTLSDRERNQKMEEWWRAHLSLLQKYRLQERVLKQIVLHEMKIRSGMDILLQTASQREIPVLVLSAGVTQSIQFVLENCFSFGDSIHIASNTLSFDSEGICNGLLNDHIIHATNKDEWDAPKELITRYADRTYVLLFGDSLDDIKMVSSEQRSRTISVGFCTSNRRHQRDVFCETYDIVVESDHTDGGLSEWLLQKIYK